MIKKMLATILAAAFGLSLPVPALAADAVRISAKGVGECDCGLSSKTYCAEVVQDKKVYKIIDHFRISLEEFCKKNDINKSECRRDAIAPAGRTFLTKDRE